MGRVVIGALVGAVFGGSALAMVAAMGSEPAVTIPIPQANGAVHPEIISLASIVSKLALILGVCTGALVGALAGVAANREALGTSASAASRPKRL